MDEPLLQSDLVEVAWQTVVVERRAANRPSLSRLLIAELRRAVAASPYCFREWPASGA
jgi:hypothetical protein